jgi:hypothetical protein
MYMGSTYRRLARKVIVRIEDLDGVRGSTERTHSHSHYRHLNCRVNESLERFSLSQTRANRPKALT